MLHTYVGGIYPDTPISLILLWHIRCIWILYFINRAVKPLALAMGSVKYNYLPRSIFMGMKIEVTANVTYTVNLSYEDVIKVREYMANHTNPLGTLISKQDVCHAVWELYNDGEISLYDDDKAVESDFYTQEINWSEFEENMPEDIF